MPKDADEMVPEDFETMAVEFADRIRKFVLREVGQALKGMPDAQRAIRKLGWRSRKRTDFEVDERIVGVLTEAGRALTFGQLQKKTGTPKGRLTLRLSVLKNKKKIASIWSHRAKRYLLPK